MRSFGGGMRAVIAVGLAASGLVGCASSEERHYALRPGQGGADVQRVRVVPVNLVVGLPVGFLGETADVSHAIGAYLESQGMQVAFGQERATRSLWELCLDEASPRDGGLLETAAAFCLVRLLSEREEFDALVFPTLLHRKAKLVDGEVHWDGVTRTLPVAPSLHRNGFTLTTLARRSMQVAAVSLQVIVFDPAGRELFHGYGGLEVVQELAPLSKGRGFHLRRREDLFVEPAELREGVGLAFHPYLQPDGAREQHTERASGDPS